MRFIVTRLNQMLPFHTLSFAAFDIVFPFLNTFFPLQDVIEIPGFYQRQWLPNYPEIVEFKYDGETYQIQVRQHKGQLYFADGLTRLRTEL